MEVLQAGLRIFLGLMPVLCFLLALVALDSYKLVRRQTVAVVLVAGGAAALLSLATNLFLLRTAHVDALILARLAAPTVEELLKGLVAATLIARRRVGFLVDAAIVGFAAGAGFATVENIHYLAVLGKAPIILWVVRGFGTALMHGSVTAIMAVLSKQISDRQGHSPIWVFLPGLLLAAALHALFNRFLVSPAASTVLLLLVLPVFFVLIFQISEHRTRDWLGTGFDTDAELLGLIGAGKVSDSRIGAYLRELKTRFPATTVADMVCLLRLRLELSIKAKGILLARQAGFSLPPDPDVEERFAEIRYLEQSIGATGLLALKPVLNINDRDLWQYHMLHRAPESSGGGPANGGATEADS